MTSHHEAVPSRTGSDAEPVIAGIAAEHLLRGVRVQSVLRGLLALFLVLTVAFDPPTPYLALTVTIVIGYAVWAAVFAVALRAGRLGSLRRLWPALFVDLAVLTILAVVISRSDATTWTTFVLLNGFAIIIPILAATQLRPGVCAALAVPAVIVYILAALAAQSTSDEPLSVILLHAMVIAVLGVGSVALSYVQRSRVATIEHLARDRAELLDEVLTLENRERAALAESLHDGALQYVLAARQDVDAMRGGSSSNITDDLDRVATALREAGSLLRSTLASLHPAVLEEHGLGPALTELARTADVGGATIVVDVAAWPAGPTDLDRVLYATARELLSNVAKHARAHRVEMTAEMADGDARLVVVDDGVGVGDAATSKAVSARLTDGHLGLASRAVRLAAIGGTLRVEQRPGGGTVAIAEVADSR